MGSSVRRAPRLAEVAKLAQVSTGLVSRVVNEDPTLRVRAETRQRVLDAVKMLNYTPDMSARALRNEIGRASCRERVELGEGGVGGSRKIGRRIERGRRDR